MRLGNLLRQKDAPGQVPAHFSCDIVPLRGGNAGALIRVLLSQLLVLIAEQGQDGGVGGVGPPRKSPLITVLRVGGGHFEVARLLDGQDDLVLDPLHCGAPGGHLADHLLGQVADRDRVGLPFDRLERLGDSCRDFPLVERDNGTVSLFDIHVTLPSCKIFSPARRQAGTQYLVPPFGQSQDIR